MVGRYNEILAIIANLTPKPNKHIGAGEDLKATFSVMA
jgi:hypothetical protein